jgi:hypothetical protein
MSNKNWSRPVLRKKNKKATHWKEASVDDLKHEKMVEKFLREKEKSCQTSSKK